MSEETTDSFLFRWLLVALYLLGVTSLPCLPSSYPSAQAQQCGPLQYEANPATDSYADGRLLAPNLVGQPPEEKSTNGKECRGGFICAVVWPRLVHLGDVATWDPVAFFTLVLAISTIGLWWVTERTLKHTRADSERQAADMEASIAAAQTAAEAAKTSADAALNTERARIFVRVEGENIAQRIREIVDRVENGPTIQENPLRVEYRIINYGKTPALIDNIFAGIRVKPWPDSPPQPFGEYWPREQRFGQVIAGLTEANRPEMVRHVEVFGLEEAQRVIGEAPDHAVWFFGEVSYRDVFKNAWYHRFLWRYDAYNGIFQPDEYKHYSEST